MYMHTNFVKSCMKRSIDKSADVKKNDSICTEKVTNYYVRVSETQIYDKCLSMCIIQIIFLLSTNL